MLRTQRIISRSSPICKTVAGVGAKRAIGVRVPEFWFPPEAEREPAGKPAEFEGKPARVEGKSECEGEFGEQG